MFLGKLRKLSYHFAMAWKYVWTGLGYESTGELEWSVRSKLEFKAESFDYQIVIFALGEAGRR